MTALNAETLTVIAGGARILDSVSFGAKGGEFIALIGPNGAGKSTLMRALASIIRAEQGIVLLDGAPLGEMTTQARARKISYLPQQRETAWAMSAEMVASLGRFAYGRPDRLGAEDRAAIARALALTDAAPLASRIMQTLSGGEQARIHLARALAAETDILLADEPTAALDMKHALAILSALRARAEKGALVIAALHDLPLAARFATRLVALDKGKIVADGAPQDVLTEEFYARTFAIRPVEGGVSFAAL